jgi:hypothetical protein
MVALSNCMVIGDKRKYLAMLLSLKTELNLETGVPTDKLASDSLFVGKNIGSSATTATEVNNKCFSWFYFPINFILICILCPISLCYGLILLFLSFLIILFYSILFILCCRDLLGGQGPSLDQILE